MRPTNSQMSLRVLRGFAVVLMPLFLVTDARSAAIENGLENGVDAAGSISAAGQTQTWTFDAAQGDGLVLSVTDSAGDAAWAPFAVLHAPNGDSLGGFGGADVGQTRLTAPQTGTYSVVVGANPNVPNGTGPYILRLAKAPGSYEVPAEDEGGEIKNGENRPGTITLGDLDLWNFNAEAGNALCVTVADQTSGSVSSLAPFIQVWGPNGASLAGGDFGLATQLCFTAPTNPTGTGTYTVLISANVNAAASTGSYILRLARAPASFVVPGDDQGGDLTDGQTYSGAIPRGDLDLWRFGADAGDALSLTLRTVNGVAPWLRVWGPNGGPNVAFTGNGQAVQQLNLTAPSSGVYLVVISASGNAPAGTADYTLLATGVRPLPPQPPVSSDKSLGSGGGSCAESDEVAGSGGGTCEQSTDNFSTDNFSDSPSDVPRDVSNTGMTCVGNPCNVATGNKFDHVTDYQTDGPNALRFTRYYNSLAGAGSATSLGRNWRHIFDRRLHLNSTTSVSAERADGRVLAFALANGVWTPDTDVDLTLTQTGSTWTLLDGGDTRETYMTNAGGTAAILTEIRARNGYSQALGYDAGGEMIRVTDSFGRSLDFTYSNGLLATLSTPDGLVVTFSYGASTGGTPDRLTGVSYGTSTRRYLYEVTTYPFALTGIIDENGQRFASWTYDAQGRAVSSEHAGGAERVEIAYDDATGTRTVRNALGLQTVYHFTMLQGVPKVTQIDRLATATTGAATRTFTYDANGYLDSSTDWKGTRTTYVNDARGLVTTITEAQGTPQERITTTAYDAHFHLPTAIARPGLTTAFTYDADGNVLTRTETDTTTNTQPYATAGTSRTWTYTWSGGLLASVRGPRADVTALTQFSYTSGALATITNALGQVTNITSHTPGGRPLTVVDRNGVTTQLAYDERQRLTSRTLSTADGALATRYTYDAAGNVLSITLPDGSVTRNSYDAAHRLIEVSDPLGQRVSYSLDALGNTTLVQLLDATNTVTRARSATFDAIGRAAQVTGGVGQATQYVRDANGNVVTTTDPLTRATQQQFDALNRRVRRADAAGGVTATAYDAWDRPVSLTAPNGAVTSYVYDGFGNLIETLSPDSGNTIYRYDLAGNLVRRDDASGAISVLTYDALDRVTAVRYPRARGEDVAYHYDESGHGFGIGRLTSVDDPVGHVSRTYDERGNILAEVRDVDRRTTRRTSYRYDAADRVVELGYPSGATVLYARDAVGRISAITLVQPGVQARTVLTGVTYKPFGPPNSLTFGNGVNESRSFDLDYRLTTLASAGQVPVQQLAYAYDAADDVVSIVDGVAPARSQTFGYDALDRLTGATGGYGQFRWTYDAAGNRLTQQTNATSSAYSYAPQSNRLIGIQDGTGQQQVSYTAAGNIAAFTPMAAGKPKKNVGTALAYNEGGRLSSILVDGRQIQSNGYDAFGQRLARTGKTSGASLFTYDIAGRLLEDADGRGNSRIDYIYLDDRPVATVTIPLSNTLAFLHDDRLGTPQLATDGTQSVVWKAAYEPFGAATIEANLVGQNLRFPGQEYEWDTGWHHNGFRDYVPALGRYLEVDPEGLSAGPNLYAYANANPTRFVDFFGLESDLETRYEALSESIRRAVNEADLTVNSPYGALAACVDRGQQTEDCISASRNFNLMALHAANAAGYVCIAAASAVSPQAAEAANAVYEAQEAQRLIANHQMGAVSRPPGSTKTPTSVPDPNRIYPNECGLRFGHCSGVARRE